MLTYGSRQRTFRNSNKGVPQLGHVAAVWEGKSELALIQTVWNDHNERAMHSGYLLRGLAAVLPHC